MAGRKKRRSEYSIAREIARRLARAGAAPFADDRSLYIVLHGDRAGEIIELGPPLRPHRMFPTKTRSRADRIAKEFAAFAADQDQTDWRFWTIHRPSRKTKLKALVKDLKAFNALINRVFTRLRKKFDFELLLLGIHIEVDHKSRLFDIHAHFVCAMPQQQREEVRMVLMAAFSRADVPDKPLRTAYGAANYIARTFKLRKVRRWPNDALLAVWKLIDHRFRYVRTGGAFATWRRENQVVADKHEKKRARDKRGP